MAVTVGQTNNQLIKFKREVQFDFLRPGRFDAYMGEDANSPIVRLADLAGDGKQINIPLVTQLSGAGVGAGILTGNEEQLDSYGMPLFADWARNAVVTTKAVNKENSFDIPSTARTALRNWAKLTIKNDIVDALLSIPTGAEQAGRLVSPGNRVNGVKWSAATAGNKNSWMDANRDRVLFGSANSNYVAGNFASSVVNVDSTNDKLTAAVLSIMKGLAQQTGPSGLPVPASTAPQITPWQSPELDEEMFLVFAGTRGFRDLQIDPTMYQANRDARAREGNPTGTNPIFTGGALKWNGMLIVEIPEITKRLLLVGVGAAAIDVEPVFLLGQGALGYAMGQMPRPTGLDDTDYEFRKGVGIEAQYGVGKIAKAPQLSTPAIGTLVDWGMVTAFVSGTATP